MFRPSSIYKPILKHLHHRPYQLVPQSSFLRPPQRILIHQPSINRLDIPQFPFSCSASAFSVTQQPTTTSHGRLLKPFLLADIGEGITGCEIIKWLVKPGQTVAEFDPIAEVQSDKATVEITSPFEGVVEQILGEPGEVIKVGEPLCLIRVQTEVEEHEPEIAKPEKRSGFAEASAPNRPREEVHSTPAVRRLAREHQLDLSVISGTGKQGRVTKEDVLGHLSNPERAEPPASQESPKQTHHDRPVRVALGGVRQAMFRGMTQSLRIPHFGYSDQMDVTELERLRQTLSNAHPDTRLTLLSLLVKIMGHAMAEHALFRSTVVPEDPPQLVQRSSSDISIAVASPAGLLTPLIPAVETKSVLEIAQHIRKLRAFISDSRPDKVPRLPEELGGNRTGTFTLSNIGIIGGTYTHPVIPPTGQLAIGAIGAVRVEPRYRPEDEHLAKKLATSDMKTDRVQQLGIEPRLVVEVSFSADHRLVEGVELARLVECFKGYCEQPGLLVGQLT